MLYQVPSGSKSPGFSFAVGLAIINALRLAISSHVPSASIRNTHV